MTIPTPPDCDGFDDDMRLHLLAQGDVL